MSNIMKNLVEAATQGKNPAAEPLEATIVYAPGQQDARPWGSWRVLCVEPTYVIKEITVNPGGVLSLQFHRHRNEYWVVLSGQGQAIISDTTRTVGAGDTAYVPAQSIHRLINNGTEPLIVIETQTGMRLDEADIVRLDDIYDRT